MPSQKRILYLVHDLTDNTVHKRIKMLVDAGCSLTVMGFSRGIPPVFIYKAKVISLGKSYDGKLIHRILIVLKIILFNNTIKEHMQEADAVVARTLEMLSIAVRARSTLSSPPPLTYECLDIHRLLLNERLIGKTLRWLEKFLMKHCSLLLSSSPAFIHEYFEKRSISSCPTYLIENKVYDQNGKLPSLKIRSPHPPWKIGWFGAIRCQKSLQILSNLAQSMNGYVEVIIRGKPSYDQFSDFDKQVSNIPNLRFEGKYKNPDELEQIYNEVHFTWAIDMFEEGLNSSWLLPNRIYEGGLYGSVPIAQSGVETGRHLSNLGIGVILDNPLDQNLASFFSKLTPIMYQKLQEKSLSTPATNWLSDYSDATRLAKSLITPADAR